MAMRNMSRGIPRLWKDGYKSFTGLEEAILKNCEAATSLAEIVRTSYGPNGLSKIIINRIEKVFITTDAATIINELDVQHPAAKVLCLAAAMQQQEIGDGANFVVIFAGELLKKSIDLLRIGIHPSDLVKGYTLAGKEASRILQEDLTVFEVNEEDVFNKNKLMMGIKSSISSKQYGLEEILSNIVAEACLNSMPKNPKNFVVDNIRMVKVLGGSIQDCEVIKGMAIDVTPRTITRKCNKTRVAIFACSVDWTQTETKGTVLLHGAQELMDYNRSEEDHMHEVIKGLHEMGVGVVVTNEKLGDMALHFLDKYRMIGLKLMSKWNVRRLCRALCARPIVQLTGVTPDDLGYVEQIYTQEIGSQAITVFSQLELNESIVSTIILRGATENVLSDLERAIDDGINIVRAMARNGKFVAGAGAAEIEIARRLRMFAQQQPGLEQYAIQKYAESLEVIPRTLAENTGLSDIDIIAKLYAAHESDNNDAQKIGVDIEAGDVRDMASEGVIDLLITRQMGLNLATQAAVTILKIDYIIMKKPAGGPKMPKRGHWDANDDSW